MKFTTRTEYGLLCMVYMAKHADMKWISIKEMSAQEHYPTAYIEKILQTLKKAGLLESQQGNHGGYALARPQAEITLKEIIDALEGGTFEVFCRPETREDIVCTHFCLCGVKPVWRKTKKLLDEFYGSITLETLTKNEIEVQHLMPHNESARS
jgi:Rrf2 family transcriptional regulator, iron-sulfur cluster assembly transcription factor